MGPVVLLTGIVLLVVGGAGLLASGGATHTRLRTTNPLWHVGQLVLGVLLTGAGTALVMG